MKYDFIYLASQSPRRQELLAQIGVHFKLLLPSRNENPESLEIPLAHEKAIDYVQRVTLAKSEAALERWQALQQNNPQFTWAPILCADTTVSLPGSLDTEILGKPTDAAHATQMLHQLSGKSHDVYSAIAIIIDTHSPAICLVQKSQVEFAALDTATIKSYVHSGEAFGKAGSYGIQGIAASFIKTIQGSYSGIMGLPLYETAKLLRQAHVHFGLNSYEPRDPN